MRMEILLHTSVFCLATNAIPFPLRWNYEGRCPDSECTDPRDSKMCVREGSLIAIPTSLGKGSLECDASNLVIKRNNGCK